MATKKNIDALDARNVHNLDIDDVERTWRETQRHATDHGVEELEVYVAICSCGHRFEGKDGADVAHQYDEHLSVVT